MLTVNDNLMPNKYFTVCQDDGAIYLYDKTNTADPATGKFRKFEGGESLPSGGTTGQLLAKKSSTDGDVEWKTVEGGDSIQVEELPEASVDELGKIYQYIGEHGIHTDFADDAVNNFVGEGQYYYYSIANNNIQLRGQTTGSGIIKCTQPLTNRSTIQITKTYNGVATNIFTNKTRIGTTVGGNDVYESPDWGRASSVEIIDLSQFAEETLYISFRVEVTQINSGQVDVYTISSVLYDAPDIHTKGYFYKCVSDGESTPTYSWEESPTFFVEDSMPAEDMAEVASPMPSVMSRRFKYSTEEQVVGEWIDGKPIYQKTYEFNTVSGTNSLGMTINPENVINFFGIVVNSENQCQALNCQHPNYQDRYGLLTYLTSTDIVMRSINGYEWALSNLRSLKVTVQYTKTTD